MRGEIITEKEVFGYIIGVISALVMLGVFWVDSKLLSDNWVNDSNGKFLSLRPPLVGGSPIGIIFGLATACISA